MSKGSNSGGAAVILGFADGQCHDAVGWRFTDTPGDSVPNATVADGVYLLNCNNTLTTQYSGNDFYLLGTGWHTFAQRSIKGVQIAMGNGAGPAKPGETLYWGSVEIDIIDPTATPTPTASNTPTNTPTPTNTHTPNAATNTAAANATGTAGANATGTAGANATATSAAATATSAAATTTPVVVGGNLIRNPDFVVAPRLTDSIWVDMNRVVQSPYDDNGLPLGRFPHGSCGTEYWTMSEAAGGSGRIWQDFGWTGGPMYINFEAVTSNYATFGRATILNTRTGEEEDLQSFTNGSQSWQTFKYLTGNKPAGRYRLGFEYTGFGAGAALAVDNVNVRRGYWGQDCDPSEYYGQLPTTTNATAVPLASPTAEPGSTGAPVNTNCNFEQGWNGYAHNAGTKLIYTGGATGPTYANLFTIPEGGFDPSPPTPGPGPVDILGRLSTTFQWSGGTMYISYFTGPGTRATVTVRNPLTGYQRTLQSGATTQSFDGWVKRSAAYANVAAGQYILEFSSPAGYSANLDGIAVAAGSFATGPCGSANSDSSNNATATAGAVSTQAAGTATHEPAAVGTANAVNTLVAGAAQTYVAGQHATATAGAHATQTSVAAGTPRPPTRTPTPNPVATELVCTLLPWVCVEDPPTVVAPNNDDLTQIADDMTQQAAAAETYWAAGLQTAQARAQQTQSARQTATGAVAAMQTQAAAIVGTATARVLQTQQAGALQTAAAINATQTAIVEAINAGATQQALATQQAQQAHATQTAVAGQATAAAGGATEQAAATNTAVSYAATYAAVTAAANAAATAGALATFSYQQTQAAQATANSAATGIALATQQAGQVQATQTAVALQTQLATQANATAAAQATTTAVAVATTVAQTTATAQAQATTVAATQIAQGTTTPGGGDDLPPVDDRPEPGPNADCIRPGSPLEVANWIDYEVCRVLRWFAWSPANTDQLLDMEADVANSFPFGFLLEVGDLLGVMGSWVTALPWCTSGFCQDAPLAPLNLEASGILVGDFDFADGTPYYSDQCDLLLAPLLGPGIQSGACFCVNVLCALGILPWAQLMFNVVLALTVLLYIQRTWLTAAHT